MIKNLRFQPAIGSINFVPRVVEPIMGDIEGNLARIGSTYPKGFRAVADHSDRSILRVYKEDLNLCVSSLNWRSVDAVEFSLARFSRDSKTGTTSMIQHDAGVAEIEVPGQFIPSITEDEIHTIVEDYKLLYDRFPVYGEIFRRHGDPMLEAMLEWLTNSQQKTFEVLMKNADRRTRKELEESKSELPKWIVRVMELRKEHKK